MAREVRLPQLGETMKEGTIVNCLVKVGDEVKKGDVIFEIETDKANLEMESPGNGFVKYIFVEINQTLPVGAPVMVLGEKDEQIPKSFIDALTGGPTAAPVVSAATPASAVSAAPVAEPGRPAGRVMASPRAKKLAEELGVDLASIKGTGPAGKITEDDVKNASEAARAPAAPAVPTAQTIAEAKLGATIPLNRLQRITAEKMLKSKHEIPCFYLTVRTDMTDLVMLRTKMNETSDVKISYNDFIIKAVATGLEKFPIMTGQLVSDSIQLAKAINIGLAISVPDGLIAPILKDVNKKGIKQIARESRDLIERAGSNKLNPTDVEGGCITVSNLGSLGIDSFIPIVVPGQCSILGIGKITDTCVPDNGNISVRKLMNMTLSVDHKVANGAYAAQFLDFVRKMLEDVGTLKQWI
jgi:pyruvate dehydrogenase E2 component (dihydrolipoamide acetyltransferase)